VDLRRTSGWLECDSEAHKCVVNLAAFDAFIRRQLEASIPEDHDFSPQVLAAAERLCDGNIDLREINCEDHNGELRWHLHSTHLAVPSMLQFVESGAKEAKHVSATDRSEVIRTCLAVVRSATPLGKGKSVNPDLSFNANKILAILQSACAHAEPHVQWSRTQVDYACDSRLAAVHHSMKQGHFKNDRVDTKKARVDREGSKCKKPNAAQSKQTQQTLAAAVTGLIPYGKLSKARNMLDLEEELLFRGIPVEEIPPLISERKEMLKHLEIERLTAEGTKEDDAAKLKTFKKQSNAPFKTSD